MSAYLFCRECGRPFRRANGRGAEPKYCSLKCANRADTRKTRNRRRVKTYRKLTGRARDDKIRERLDEFRALSIAEQSRELAAAEEALAWLYRPDREPRNCLEPERRAGNKGIHPERFKASLLYDPDLLVPNGRRSNREYKDGAPNWLKFSRLCANEGVGATDPTHYLPRPGSRIPTKNPGWAIEHVWSEQVARVVVAPRTAREKVVTVDRGLAACVICGTTLPMGTIRGRRKRDAHYAAKMPLARRGCGTADGPEPATKYQEQYCDPTPVDAAPIVDEWAAERRLRAAKDKALTDPTGQQTLLDAQQALDAAQKRRKTARDDAEEYWRQRKRLHADWLRDEVRLRALRKEARCPAWFRPPDWPSYGMPCADCGEPIKSKADAVPVIRSAAPLSTTTRCGMSDLPQDQCDHCIRHSKRLYDYAENVPLEKRADRDRAQTNAPGTALSRSPTGSRRPTGTLPVTRVPQRGRASSRSTVPELKARLRGQQPEETRKGDAGHTDPRVRIVQYARRSMSELNHRLEGNGLLPYG